MCPIQTLFPHSDRKELYKNYTKGGVVDVQTSDIVLMGAASSDIANSLATATEEDKPVPDVFIAPGSRIPRFVKVPINTITQTQSGFKTSVEVDVEDRCETILGYTPVRKDEETEEEEEDAEFIKMVIHAAEELASHPQPPECSSLENPPSYNRMREELLDEQGTRIGFRSYRRNLSDILYNMRWKRLINSEGKPQFLELLPIFFRHLTLGIYTIKLTESLDDHPMIEYTYGKSFVTLHKSRYTHEQIIRYWMRAFMSQARNKGHFKCMFIGTHYGPSLQHPEAESLVEKNTRLQEIAEELKMMDCLVYSCGFGSLIFPIYGQTPGPEDKAVMDEVNEVIKDNSKLKSPTIVPIRWIAMELVLLRYVKSTGRAVLLESECYEMMSRFHFTRDDFVRALEHLSWEKIIFYFKCDSQGLVIADMRVILNKLNEIVGYCVELNISPQEFHSLNNMWRKFCKYGILNIECLDMFPDHYIEGVFSAKELVELFKQLHIVSELKPREEFLMPSLLPVEDQACCNPDPDTQPVPALALAFPEGGPILGTYCGLLCHLMSKEGWKLAEKNYLPEHISRNCAYFKVPVEGVPGKITINDPLSSFFVVTFHGDYNVAAELCPSIQETIVRAIEEVSENLTGSLSQARPQGLDLPRIAFVCECGAPSLHIAEVSKDGKYWKCSLDDTVGGVTTRDYKVWYAAKQAPAGMDSLIIVVYTLAHVRTKLRPFNSQVQIPCLAVSMPQCYCGYNILLFG